MITAKADLCKIKGVKFLQKDGRKFLEITDAKLYEGKNGAVYLDLALFESPDDKFGNDWRVCQSVSKEARAAGDKGAILGNGKNVGRASAPRPQVHTHMNDGADADVPF